MQKYLKYIPAVLIVATVLAFGATSSAIYLHHQRSTLADLEADLQNREIGLDFANKTAAGKFADGTKFHLISQEQPSVALTGNLTVSGNTTLSNGLTLSAQTASRPLWTNASSQVTTNAPTGTGTTLVLSASPSITGTLAGASSTWSGTLGVTGALSASSTGTIIGDLTVGNGTTGSAVSVKGATATTAGYYIYTGNSLRWFMYKGSATESGSDAGAPFRISAYTDASAFIDNPIEITRAAGGAITLARPVTHSSTLTQTGLLTAAAGVSIAGGATSAGSIYKASNSGLTLRGVTGSSYDFAIMAAIDPGTTYLIRNPTGGTLVEFPAVGGVTIGGTFTNSALAGTGTRLTTSTSTGVQGNATTIAGANAWSDAQTFGGGLTLGGRFIDKTTSLTSNTTLSTAHSTIFADATSGAITLTLPATSGNAGLTYTVFKVDLSSNTVTLDGNASETIQLALTQVMAGNGGRSRIVIVCDGTNWQVKEFYDSGTFTATLTGCTAGVTGTAIFERVNLSVILYLPAMSGTSNTTAMTITGLPASLRPARGQDATVYSVRDNSLNYSGDIYVNTSGVIDAYFRSSLTVAPGKTYTSSGTKGIGECTSTYLML